MKKNSKSGEKKFGDQQPVSRARAQRFSDLDSNRVQFLTVYSLETERYGLGLGTQVFKYDSASRLRRTTIMSEQLDSLSLSLSSTLLVFLSCFWPQATPPSPRRTEEGQETEEDERKEG